MDRLQRPRPAKSLRDSQVRALAALRLALGWEKWERNALRHSFGSHRLAIVKSYDQVALEMGNSSGQVRKHYNDPKDEAAALQYFQILPPVELSNLIPFQNRAAS